MEMDELNRDYLKKKKKMHRTHLFENKLATVTPLSNLVMVGTGASVMYEGIWPLLDDNDDATVAAAAVDIFLIVAAAADDDDNAAEGWAAVAVAAMIRRLARSWIMMMIRIGQQYQRRRR